MNTRAKIPGTEEAWETGQLGNDEEFAVPLPEADAAADIAAINEALGLQPISIRLEKSLIEDFKLIAQMSGLSYQPLMRQVLRRFADCEKKRILRETAERMKAEGKTARKAPAESRPRRKKAA